MESKLKNPFDCLQTIYKDQIEIRFKKVQGKIECTLIILEEDRLFKFTRIIENPNAICHELRYMEQKLVQNYIDGYWTERHYSE